MRFTQLLPRDITKSLSSFLVPEVRGMLREEMEEFNSSFKENHKWKREIGLYAIRHGYFSLLVYLVDKKNFRASKQLLRVAAEESSVSCYEYLLKKKAKVDSYTLISICRGGSVNIFRHTHVMINARISLPYYIYGDNDHVRFSRLIGSAVVHNRQLLVEELLTMITEPISINMKNYLTKCAYASGMSSMVNLLKGKEITGNSHAIFEGSCNAFQCGFSDIIRCLPNCFRNLELLAYAIRAKQDNIVKALSPIYVGESLFWQCKICDVTLDEKRKILGQCCYDDYLSLLKKYESIVSDLDIPYLYTTAIIGGAFSVLKYLVSKYPPNSREIHQEFWTYSEEIREYSCEKTHKALRWMCKRYPGFSNNLENLFPRYKKL